MADRLDDPLAGIRVTPPAEAVRPKRNSRRAFATAELTAEEIARFEKTQMHPRHNQLDAEFDEPAL